MPQATRRWISEKVKSRNESNVLPFHDILDAKMVNAALASAGVTFKERIYTPFVTLCMFLSQVLDPDHSCRAAVARLIVWLSNSAELMSQLWDLKSLAFQAKTSSRSCSDRTVRSGGALGSMRAGKAEVFSAPDPSQSGFQPTVEPTGFQPVVVQFT